MISCLAVLLMLLAPGPSAAEDEAVGILLSREITPYITMVEELEARLGSLQLQRFFLDEQGNPYSLGSRGTTLVPARYAALVAVGPEALRYLLPRAGSVPLFYGMILNPEKIVPADARLPCGVSLNLPVKDQLGAIRQHFPATARVGVLFDPANNQQWLDDASVYAASLGMHLVPLRVNQQDSKLDIVGDFSRLDAILFIPDSTIISRAVIQHVIKQAVLHRIPVVGYNQFFHESGAALSLIIDYRKVGQQVADLVQQLLAGERCRESLAPAFSSRVNRDAWRALGLPPPQGAAR